MAGQQLSRSRSFGGGSRRGAPASPSAAPGGTMTSLSSTHSWQQQYSSQGSGKRPPPPVLGQHAPPTPRELRRAFSLPPHVKVPKSPRPERSLAVGGAVVRGLREGVAATTHDLMSLRRLRHASHRAMSHGRLYEAEKQMKSVQRYQKRLEYHLSQVEDLLDQYSLHQKLRDGVRNMAYAYAMSPGKERTSALNNVRSGYKECTDTLCALEVQIEHLIGTLTLEMKGIQGFARLCPGDVFEVTMKHGRQKWRSRGRVGREGAQTWDNSRAVFKALIGEGLHMKAVEVRLLGKSVLIGQRECETRELFSPYPQLMTVNLNHAGSLKLSVVVTWNPLDSNSGGGGAAPAEESPHSILRTASLSSSPSTLGGGRLLHTPTGGMPSSSTPLSFVRLLSRPDVSSSIPECADNDSSFGSMSARSSSPDSSASPLPATDSAGTTADNNADSQECLSCCSSVSPSCDTTGNFTLVRKAETRTEQWAKYSQFSVSTSSNLDLISRSHPHLPSLTRSSSCLHQAGTTAPETDEGASKVGLSASLAQLHKDKSGSLLSLLNAIRTTPSQSPFSEPVRHSAPDGYSLSSSDTPSEARRAISDSSQPLSRLSSHSELSTKSASEKPSKFDNPVTATQSSSDVSNAAFMSRSYTEVATPRSRLWSSHTDDNPSTSSPSHDVFDSHSNMDGPGVVELSGAAGAENISEKEASSEALQESQRAGQDRKWIGTSSDAWDASDIPRTLPELVARVHSCLEDIQGQFAVLHELEEAVHQLDSLCAVASRRGSVDSTSSFNIEAALECFDFLDDETDSPLTARRGITDSEASVKSPESLDPKIFARSNVNSLESKCSAKSSLSNTLEDKSTSEGSKSSDSSTLEDKSKSSGTSSLSNTLEDKSNKSAELSSGTSTLELDPPRPPCAGSQFVFVSGCLHGCEELQKFLYVHLRRVLKLLLNLGLFGPLRQLEQLSVRQLESEGQLLQAVLSHSHQLETLRPHHLLTIPHVQVLWDSVSPSSAQWCVSGSAVVEGLLPVVSSLVPAEHSGTLPVAVLETLVERMSGCGRGQYSGSEVITAGHFLQHLRPPLQTTVPAVAEGLLLASKLSVICPSSIKTALSELHSPDGAHAVRLGCLLHSAPPHIVHLVTEYVASLHGNPPALAKMLEVCLLELESPRSDDRAAACELLATIAALTPQPCPHRQPASSTAVRHDRTSLCIEPSVMENKLDVPLYINEEEGSNHSSSVSSNLDSEEFGRGRVSETSSKPHRKKRESENVISQLLNRRRSNASSTSSTRSTKSSKSNVDSGISSSPKRGSLVSSLESSSSADGKRSELLTRHSSHVEDIMSSSYPSAVNSQASLAQRLQCARPHSSYESHPLDSTTASPLEPYPAVRLATLSQFIEVLSFVQHNDNSSKVQKAAKRGLQQLGSEGAEAMQQWTLSAHGFQGVKVRREKNF